MDLKLSGPERWETIRTYYGRYAPAIFERSKVDGVGRTDPYWLPWEHIFSPIESMTWNAIRSAGLPFYPQIPVLNYFIDFGNPVLKVGLEVDGADWPRRDEELCQQTLAHHQLVAFAIGRKGTVGYGLD